MEKVIVLSSDISMALIRRRLATGEEDFYDEPKKIEKWSEGISVKKVDCKDSKGEEW